MSLSVLGEDLKHQESFVLISRHVNLYQPQSAGLTTPSVLIGVIRANARPRSSSRPTQHALKIQGARGAGVPPVGAVACRKRLSRSL